MELREKVEELVCSRAGNTFPMKDGKPIWGEDEFVETLYWIMYRCGATGHSRVSATRVADVLIKEGIKKAVKLLTDDELLVLLDDCMCEYYR